MWKKTIFTNQCNVPGWPTWLAAIESLKHKQISKSVLSLFHNFCYFDNDEKQQVVLMKMKAMLIKCKFILEGRVEN